MELDTSYTTIHWLVQFCIVGYEEEFRYCDIAGRVGSCDDDINNDDVTECVIHAKYSHSITQLGLYRV